MDYEYLIIILLCFILAAIIIFLFKYIQNLIGSNKSKDKNSKSNFHDNNIERKRKNSTKKNNNAQIIPKNSGQRCPICNSILGPGQNLQSKVFKTGSTDELCHITGCPHCFPHTEVGVNRICPVCRKRIPADGYLIARIFHKQTKNDHVHIIGCTECNKRP